MRVQELNEELQAAKESAKAAKGQESSLKEEVNGLNQDLQRSHRAQRRLQGEKEAREQEIQELKQQIKRLSSALQVGGRNGIWSSAPCFAFVCNRPFGSAVIWTEIDAKATDCRQFPDAGKTSKSCQHFTR